MRKKVLIACEESHVETKSFVNEFRSSEVRSKSFPEIAWNMAYYWS